MSHTKDYWERIRSAVITRLGLVAQLVEDVTGRELYLKGETHNKQFVGRVPMSEEQFEGELHDMGFERNPLAALKRLGTTGEQEEGSFRKVGYDEHPDMQLHVILYDGEPLNNASVNVTYVYAHWEYRWDTNPRAHYNGKKTSGPEGVRRMKKELDENGIIYEPIRP